MGMRQITITCGTDVLTVEGLFLYGEHPAGTESIQAFWKDYISQKPVFDNCIGSYRVRVTREDGSELYFGDNAGVLSWYLDTEQGVALKRLSDVSPERRRPDDPLPSFCGLAAFMGWARHFKGSSEAIRKNAICCRTDGFRLFQKSSLRWRNSLRIRMLWSTMSNGF